MKKQILSILFTLSFLISFSQLVSYEAIWVNDGMEDDYIAVEEMWSEVKKQAIADNLQDFWIVFKVEKDSTNPDHLTKFRSYINKSLTKVNLNNSYNLESL